MLAALKSYFRVAHRKSEIKTELLAGLTSFSTTAYIILLNPQILSAAGMDFGAVMTATIAASVIATLAMGLWGNFPFILAPGMGLNAYFTYGIVLESGFHWTIALGACFWAGILFILLNVIGIRRKIMHHIPGCLQVGTAAGIGFFLALIGMHNIGLLEYGSELKLGNVFNPQVVLTALGVVVIAGLMARGFSTAIIIGIFLNWLIGLIFGFVKWHGLVSLPPSLAPTFLKADIWGAFNVALIPVILSIAFIVIFDVAGTILTLANQADLLDSRQKLPKANRALNCDSFGSTVGALLGTSPLTIHFESLAGISAGGRTGLTAVVVALLFLISLFFEPLLHSVPQFATAPVLIIIGALMLKQIALLNWEDLSEIVPAFIILVTIPMTYSVANGIAMGFLTFPFIKLLAGKRKEIHWLTWILAAIFLLKFSF